MDCYDRANMLSRKMQDCLQIYEDMLGEIDSSKAAEYGFVPGLQLRFEAQTLKEQRKNLKKGVFQVLFAGGYGCGKTTLLNALAKKDVFRISFFPDDAIGIKKVCFSQDTEKVTVYEKAVDNPNELNAEDMSIQQFLEDYCVSQDCSDKGANVDHVEICLTEAGFGDGTVQLVDTDGLGFTVSDTLARHQAMQNADAIVFVINSCQAFSMDDKIYIDSRFANRQMRNIFFVLTRIDCLSSEEMENFKEYVRHHLHDVFTNRNGNFDEELFKKRVFYTNAYGSLNARLGKSIKTPYGLIMVDDATTGVPELEAALGEFLTSDDRDKEAFRWYLPLLARDYVAAMDRIDTVLEAHRQCIEQLAEKRLALDNLMHNKEYIESVALEIENVCKEYTNRIWTLSTVQYCNCIERIGSNWDISYYGSSTDFTLKERMALTMNRDDSEKIQSIVAPVINIARQYVTAELTNMVSGLKQQVKIELNITKQQLDLQQMRLNRAGFECPITMDDIQMVMPSAIDNILLINDAFFEDISNRSDYLLAIAPFNAKSAESIYQGMKKDLIESGLKTLQHESMKRLHHELSSLSDAGKEAVYDICASLKDRSVELDLEVKKYDKDREILESEIARTNRIHELLLASISEMNQLLNGLPLTDSDVRKLAV